MPFQSLSQTFTFTAPVLPSSGSATTVSTSGSSTSGSAVVAVTVDSHATSTVGVVGGFHAPAFNLHGQFT